MLGSLPPTGFPNSKVLCIFLKRFSSVLNLSFDKVHLKQLFLPSHARSVYLKQGFTSKCTFWTWGKRYAKSWITLVLISFQPPSLTQKPLRPPNWQNAVSALMSAAHIQDIGRLVNPEGSEEDFFPEKLTYFEKPLVFSSFLGFSSF